MTDAARIIETLDLKPHPEGGHFGETWRAPAEPGERSVGTAIYYLLQAGEVSHWPQLVIPAGVWQSARSLGIWTLVGCTVSPGFEFSGFEMAPVGWQPGPD